MLIDAEWNVVTASDHSRSAWLMLLSQTGDGDIAATDLCDDAAGRVMVSKNGTQLIGNRFWRLVAH